MRGKLLIIDDDRIFGAMLRKHLEKEYQVSVFADPEEAVEHFRGGRFDVVLTDLNMPKMDGIEVLKVVKTESFSTDVVVMTAFAGVDTAVKAMKKGAYDYIAKPFAVDELLLLLRNIFEKRRLFDDNLNLKKVIETTYRPENIVGESEEIKKVYQFIERAARSDATVLITGESGTGKELVAKALHFASGRKERRFVSVNCSAIPETLLEAELFGFVKGAFSGAGKDKMGLFEFAEGGTVFLDEIADAPAGVQAKLLRVLQGHTVRPLGGSEETAVDVRVICATNRDLKDLIERNKFREDLFYRINVISVHLPALRERENDIPLLIGHFLNRRKKVDPKVVHILSRYGWPGNVRQLKNLIEKLVVLSDGDVILPGDLPPEVLGLPSESDEAGLSYVEAKKRVIDSFNQGIINRSLINSGGNVTKAAEDLGLDRANFQRLMRKYRIASVGFKGMDILSD